MCLVHNCALRQAASPGCCDEGRLTNGGGGLSTGIACTLQWQVDALCPADMNRTPGGRLTARGPLLDRIAGWPDCLGRGALGPDPQLYLPRHPGRRWQRQASFEVVRGLDPLPPPPHTQEDRRPEINVQAYIRELNNGYEEELKEKGITYIAQRGPSQTFYIIFSLSSELISCLFGRLLGNFSMSLLCLGQKAIQIISRKANIRLHCTCSSRFQFGIPEN